MRKSPLACVMISLILATAPAARGQESAPSVDTPLDGIWSGTLGGEPVRACFDGSMGSFYRLADKQSVWLWSEQPLVFAERDDRDPANPRWRLAAPIAGALEGERVEGNARLPIALRQVPFTPRPESEEVHPETPCRSLSYVAGRLEPLAVTEEPVQIGGVDLVRIVARPPHNGESYEYRTFRLAGTQPGLEAVNQLLAALIDRRGPGESSWSQCMISAGHGGGDFHEALEPTRIGRRFLVASLHREDSCGGNHPNTANYPRIFDLEAGREVAVRDWLAPAALDQETLALIRDLDDEHEPNVLPLSAGLRRLIMRFASDPDADCRGSLDGASFWTIGVGRNGLRFSPHLAHVAQACGQDVDVPFARLTPFLSAEGRRAVALLAADRPVFAP